MFQVCVIVLLFLIAAAFFPPLLLVIPLILVGLAIHGVVAAIRFLARRGKPRPRVRTASSGGLSDALLNSDQARSPQAAAARSFNISVPKQVPRAEVANWAGQEVTALVNRGLKDGMTEGTLIAIFRRHCGTSLFIQEGKLNITEDELIRIAPMLPALRAAFDGSSRRVRIKESRV